MNTVKRTLFDSHCHFDFSEFDQDRDEVIAHCRSLGVQGLLIPGVSPEQWPRARAICDGTAKLFYAAGIHPWWVEQLSDKSSDNPDALAARIEAELSQANCIAVGECGLDGAIDTPMSDQQKIFDLQLQLAERTDRPLIIHHRKSHHLILEKLTRFKLSAGGVIHAFSGSYEVAMQYIEKGFYLGVGGVITYPRAKKTRDALARVPLERILLETDAPDMPLAGAQGRRNSPECIPDVARALARLREVSFDKIAEQTNLNCQQLFGISLEASEV